MKKIIIIAVFVLGATLFFTSCSPYYYDRSYVRSYQPPPPRVYVRPVVPYYYSTPPPVYRYRRQHIHRHYRRY